MRIELQSKFRGRVRRLFLPASQSNVAAFLTGDLAGTYPEMVGEPYRDGSGRFYTPLVREPVCVYAIHAARQGAQGVRLGRTRLPLPSPARSARGA